MRFLRCGTFVLTFCFWQISFAQKSYTKEISITADNDLFISYVNDKYYSSGLFFEYRYLDKTSNLENKSITQWSLNQEIYTPFKSIIQNKSEHDRPFAGYLYVSFGKLKTTKNSLIENTYQIGVLGPMALGKDFQVWIHNIYGFPEPIGWRYQIKNTLAIHYQKDKIKKLNQSKSRCVDYFYAYGYSVGTVKTNANLSLQGRIGLRKLADFKNSLAFRTNLSQTVPRKIESFFHWKIQSNLVLYDATMQGSLFNNDSPVTFTPNRVQFSFELSYLFTANSWNFGYKTVYQTNERSNLTRPNGHFFGGFFLSKLLY